MQPRREPAAYLHRPCRGHAHPREDRIRPSLLAPEGVLGKLPVLEKIGDGHWKQGYPRRDSRRVKPRSIERRSVEARSAEARVEKHSLVRFASEGAVRSGLRPGTRPPAIVTAQAINANGRSHAGSARKLRAMGGQNTCGLSRAMMPRAPRKAKSSAPSTSTLKKSTRLPPSELTPSKSSSFLSARDRFASPLRASRYRQVTVSEVLAVPGRARSAQLLQPPRSWESARYRRRRQKNAWDWCPFELGGSRAQPWAPARS